MFLKFQAEQHRQAVFALAEVPREPHALRTGDGGEFGEIHRRTAEFVGALIGIIHGAGARREEGGNEEKEARFEGEGGQEQRC